MIKEFKVNLFRILRTKSFYVVLIILLALSVFSAFVVFFVSDDPLDVFYSDDDSETLTTDELVQVLQEAEQKYMINSQAQSLIAESQLPDTGDPAMDSRIMEAMESISNNEKSEESADAYNESFQSSFMEGFQLGLSSIRPLNNTLDVLNMSLGNELHLFLFQIIVALYIGAEYKSRFHINRFSLNTTRATILLGEWLTLQILFVLMMVLEYFTTLGLSVLFCSSFEWTRVSESLIRFGYYTLIVMAYTSFTFMIAVLRRGSAMAIVFSSLFTFDVLHLVFAVASILNSKIMNLSPSFLLSTVSTNNTLTIQTCFAVIAILIGYIAVFVGSTLSVSSYRDAY